MREKTNTNTRCRYVYEGVSQLYVGKQVKSKQGCESLFESPYSLPSRSSRGGRTDHHPKDRPGLALLILGPDLSLTKTDTFGLTCMFSGPGLFWSENCAGCSNSPIGLITIQ